MTEQDDFGWVRLADAPGLLAARFGHREDHVRGPLIASVSNFRSMHGGFASSKSESGSCKPNDMFMLPHRVAGWNIAKQCWGFDTGVKDQSKLLYGLEIDKEEVRVHDWVARRVNWLDGTVHILGDRRCDIQLHWRNLVRWRTSVTAHGILKKGVVSTTAARSAATERSLPRPTPVALARWFDQRVANWPATKPTPSAADDFSAAAPLFRSGINRAEFRDAREKCTPEAWRKQGPRQPKTLSWPF